MEEKDKEILRKHWTYLTGNMYVCSRMLDFIFEEKGISDSEYDLLRKEKDMGEKIRCLLRCLMRKKNGLQILLKSLRETEHGGDIAEKLQESCKTRTGKVNRDQYVTLTLMVLRKSKEIIEYCNKNGDTIRAFDIVGATLEKACVVRIYREKDFTQIFVGSACKFENLVRKGDDYLGTKDYKLYFTKKFEVPESVKQNAPNLAEIFKDGEKRTLQKALNSFIAMSSIQGQVVQVSPLDFVKDGSLTLKYLNLKDESGTAKLTLFQEYSRMEFKVKDIIRVTNVYRNEYEGSVSLSASSKSICEKIEDRKLRSLDIKEEDLSRDDDFLTEERRENATVIEFSDVVIYPCCSNPDCRKYSVKDDECPKCKSSWMKKYWCCADFSLLFEDKRTETFPLFASDISAILGDDVDMSSDASLISQIQDRMPLNFSCTIKKKKIRNIVRKRPFDD